MDPKQHAAERFAHSEDRLQELNRWMFEHPEIAYEERESSARLVEALAESGFDVSYPAYGLDTAFAARVGDGGPRVIICAEYDALPGIGHACGHNIIATAAVGAGHALADLAGTLGIEVTVLGTPAEEHYGGKVDLLRAGAFEGAAVAMMVHPSTQDVVDPNVIAVAHLDLEYRGKEAHASSHPQEGRNALDAFVQAYVNVSTLRQHLHPTDKVHGIITHGGDAPNIIPDLTRSSWYVRAQTRERLEELWPRVEACFQAGAVASGCDYEVIQVGHTYEELISNPILVEVFRANAEALGRRMLRGADLPPSQTGSTDMGNVSQVVPAIHPMLSIDSLPAVNHQRAFAAHTVSAAGERAIRDGALGMAWSVIDLATQDLWSRL